MAGKHRKAAVAASENRSDLALQGPLTDETVVACLRERHASGLAYTAVGPHLVALNPWVLPDPEYEKESLSYVAAYKEMEQQITLEPHLYSLVNHAYYHMRRTGSDQHIVLSGQSGSGKSMLRELSIRHLVELTRQKKKSKVEVPLLHAQRVLEAFGHANVGHTNASQFGYYCEMMFNDRGRMVAAKTLHYLLDKSRVTAGQGTFQVFHILAGASTEEDRQALQIDHDPSAYTFLGKRFQSAPPQRQTWDDLKKSLKGVGFRKAQIHRIGQLLAAILFLGNLEFNDPTSASTQEAASVKNVDVLYKAAEMLGVEDPSVLEGVLVYKTALIGKDTTTLILNAEQAKLQRDELATALYSLLFAWIVEHINTKTCPPQEEECSFIGVLDMPGSHGLALSDRAAGFQSFCVNLANERIHQHIMQRFFQTNIDSTWATGSQTCLEVLTKPSRGVCAILDRNVARNKKGTPKSMDSVMDEIIKYNDSNPAFEQVRASTQARHFAIQHHMGKVTYDPTDFVLRNDDTLPVDFVMLFCGSPGVMPRSSNEVAVELFENPQILSTKNHPRQQNAIISAQQSSQPLRKPSMRKSLRRQHQDEPTASAAKDTPCLTVLSQTQSAIGDLLGSVEEAKLWHILCVTPNNNQSRDRFDSLFVQGQIKAYHLSQLAAQPHYIESYEHDEFLSRYAAPLHDLQLNHTQGTHERIRAVADYMGWSEAEYTNDSERVWMGLTAWIILEDQLRKLEKDKQRQDKDHHRALSTATLSNDFHPFPSSSVIGTDDQSVYSDPEYSFNESGSYAHTDAGAAVKQLPVEELEEPPPKEVSGTRRRWLWFVWAVTWWIPSKFLVWCGHMKRRDVRIAWREKVALCCIIFFMCAFVIWFLVFFGEVVCPHQNVFSTSELASHDKDASKTYVSIRGEVFDLTAFGPRHYPGVDVLPSTAIMAYGGQDVTSLFPVQVSDLCDGVSPFVSLDYQVNYTDPNAQYHDFRYSSEDYDPNWYYNQITMLRKNFKMGNMGYEQKAVSDQAESATLVNGIKTTRNWAILNDRIYDMTSYMLGGRYLSAPPGTTAPGNADTNFMNAMVVDLFRQGSGQDITDSFNSLPLDSATKNSQLACLRNLFYVGVLDTRNSAKCQFSTYLLLIVTCLMASVIVFKFLAALRFGSRRAPESHDKYVIAQVTCYTEDEESLSKTINSVAKLDYDDKHKLLFVICDGMIVGSGNDRPTPRIVLDILGVDASVDPEPLSFVSVGEGQKQHNMGKIYSGLYEFGSHVVPYIVVVKCGKPTERQKPGNRGKRDSQLILMQFLNRVHHDAPMNPLQLEIYHQLKNVIGIEPSFYELVLMVDADTEVMPDGLNNLVSSMVHDSKIVGICGETTLSNEKDTWVTMIQVYEYFISHHMIKAFESLFSTVSCLPGCFTMYRVRTVDGKRALLVSNEIINDYSVNVVDTLHKKNLLHLGEDRYLTTLLLKHFSNFKTKFTADAQCKTNAPDQWSVLVSQRRRWINSTIHNLGELVFLPRLCGFCCFSMRFVVMLDLISTLVMPAIMGYLGYLIYRLATSDGTIPIVSVATIAGTYGLQAIIFIFRRKWEYLIWMLVSILAIPVFSFYIPIYSYWHFDDFSWGNTRVVVGDKGQKMAIIDESEFDPKSIPTMRWSEYERKPTFEDWNDTMSQYSGSQHTYAMNRPQSGYTTAMGYLPEMDARTVYSTGNLSQMAPMSMYEPAFDQSRHSRAASMNLYQPYQPFQAAMGPSSVSIPLMALNSPTITPPLASPSSGASRSSQPQYAHDNSFASTGPTNHEIMQQIKVILLQSDLNQITKKQVRQKLQDFFHVESMADRKDFINACIEQVLQEHV